MDKVAYCKDCASILFKYYHNYTVDVQKTFKWKNGSPDGVELTPADETHRDGSSWDLCPVCNEEDIIFLEISNEVSAFLSTHPHLESISIVLTEEELDGGVFDNITRLKKSVAKQLLAT